MNILQQAIESLKYKPADIDIFNKVASLMGGGSDAYKTTEQQPVYPLKDQLDPKAIARSLQPQPITPESISNMGANMAMMPMVMGGMQNVGKGPLSQAIAESQTSQGNFTPLAGDPIVPANVKPASPMQVAENEQFMKSLKNKKVDMNQPYDAARGADADYKVFKTMGEDNILKNILREKYPNDPRFNTPPQTIDNVVFNLKNKR